ncbi:MAG: MarR family transcriptional regulator [Phycisphaerae bacterium]|nr:MarR family transcriptional regulator [Phycisphaerae bacterium]
MALKDELGFNRDIEMLAHEAILNIYHTVSCLKKAGDEFFKAFGLTDVQFNLLMLLKYQTSDNKGMTQATISKMMLVNRANITMLVDRMEKGDLVTRTAAPGDRRSNIVIMTEKGEKLLDEVEVLYAQRIQLVMADLNEDQQKNLIQMMETVRANASKLAEN